MGSPEKEKKGNSGEIQHEVEFSKDYYLGVLEVTQAQYKAVMGENPSHFSLEGDGKEKLKKDKIENTDDFPVESVSWEDAQAFLKKVNELPEKQRKGLVYRLPSEAE